MTLDVSVDRDEKCFEAPEWMELLARDPNRQIFAYPEWCRTWWDEFNAGKELFVLTMRRGDQVAGIVPLYRKQEGARGIFRFVGGIDLTDYLGPICSLDDRDDVADALVHWLATTELEWHELDAHSMPVPLGFAEFLVERADAAGFTFAFDQEETSAVLSLPRDWDSYLEKLKPKDRHELRRKRRRLENSHPDAVVRTATEETLDADFKTFVEMHRGAEGHKGHFMDPGVASFFELVARRFIDRGWLRLDLLEIEGRAVASTFGFQLERKYYLYNSAYEPDAARLSPGLVLVSEVVKRTIDEGLELFDLLRGPERYKYQLGATAVPLNNVRVFNPRAAETTPA